jgi:hypothetical protein
MNSTKWLRPLGAAVLACGLGCNDNAGSPERPSERDAAVDAEAPPPEPAEPCVPDESAAVPADRCSPDPAVSELPTCQRWVKVEPEQARCSDGSQYKFFVNYSERSNNLVVMFEGGGACWDYASCTGGARGAANRNGIPETHMERSQFLNLLRRDDQNPLKDWNMVFLPYCTGDVHTGKKVAQYEAPDGSVLTYHHLGHFNTLSVIGWLMNHFESVPKLLVTGFSAGGIGALQNYHYVRRALTGVQCGYLLNDSGPLFHSDGPSHEVQATTRAAWDVDSLFDEMARELSVRRDVLESDLARLNTALADAYPHDRLALTVYEMDLNYSLYSYERFFPGISEAEVHEKWSEELSRLLDTYDTRPNLSYYVPYFRHDNCSHCVSIPPVAHDTATILATPWLGTEIEEAGVNLRDYVELLLDDSRPLQSYHEAPQPSEQFTPEEVTKCMTP